MKQSIIGIILLSVSSFSFNANATTIEHYEVVQEHITIKIAPKSGLPKASCEFFNKQGDKIAGQNVTVSEQWDNVTIIEANLYTEQHNIVYSVKCD